MDKNRIKWILNGINIAVIIYGFFSLGNLSSTLHAGIILTILGTTSLIAAFLGLPSMGVDVVTHSFLKFLMKNEKDSDKVFNFHWGVIMFIAGIAFLSHYFGDLF